MIVGRGTGVQRKESHSAINGIHVQSRFATRNENKSPDDSIDEIPFQQSDRAWTCQSPHTSG